MISQWGMSERLGPLSTEGAGNNIFSRNFGESREISEHTQEIIDDEIKRLLLHAEHEVFQLLSLYRAVLDAIVKQLLDHETLNEQKIQAIYFEHQKAT